MSVQHQGHMLVCNLAPADQFSIAYGKSNYAVTTAASTQDNQPVPSRRSNVLLIIGLLCLFSLSAWLIQWKITHNSKQEIAASLSTLRDTTHLSVANWFKDQAASTAAWAETDIIRQTSLSLLSQPRHKQALIQSQAQVDLRNWFNKLQSSTRYSGYVIVGPGNITLASSEDSHIGRSNILSSQAGFLQRIWEGQSRVSMPFRSDFAINDNAGQNIQGIPILLAASPVRDRKQQVIALFMFRLAPKQGFTNILNQGRIGASGESYAFDHLGRLISQSRFDNQLQQLGMLPNRQQAILNIELRDPGVNLIKGETPEIPLRERPFTFMVRTALKHAQAMANAGDEQQQQIVKGLDLLGHRDYRGVTVLSAWLWDQDLQLGIATEIDMAEAYSTLRTTQLSILGLTLFIFLLLMVLLLVYKLLEQLKLAKGLAQQEKEKTQLYFDTVQTIILVLDHNANIASINQQGCNLLGYQQHELLGKNWFTTCLCESERESAASIFTSIMQGESEGIAYFENEVLTRDGKHRLIAWHNAYLHNEIGAINATLSAGEDITERKKVEVELRRAATVFDNTDEAIIVANAKAEIIMVNKSFTKITGYQQDEVLGKNPRLQQSGKHDQAFYKNMWGKLNEKGQWRGELWNRRKNGDIYPAWENINIVRDEQGEITNYVAIFSDISDLKQSEQKMSYLAHHDALTNLPNRLRFMANLEQAVAGAKRHKTQVALMFIDLDKFKQVNDTLGHSTGDQLLISISKRLRQCVRDEDTVARLGGDEFTVVLTEIKHARDASIIAGKIVAAAAEPILIHEHSINTSASIGISIYPDDAANVEDLVKAADTAMYHAKEQGKNNYQFYTQEMAERVFKHARIESDIRKALANHEFSLCYQPQVDIKNGRITGVEALIRWQHPEHGLLYPDQFIPVADDSHLIDSVSEWVLRQALLDCKKWTSQGTSPPNIAINITGKQITSERSISSIINIIDELEPNPKVIQLDLEITEKSLQHTENTIEVINALRQRGVMFAIDDFGTGHSSLSLLKKLPVDTLKIDQSFIRRIAETENDRTVTAAIIAMAHSLGLSVIGEGVETRAQLDTLKSLGCDQIQGFYFSQPISADKLSKIINKEFT